VQDLAYCPATPLFMLAHQGLNDVQIQRKYSRLFRPIAPLPPPPQQTSNPSFGPSPVSGRAEDARIRVGFISTLFPDHTVGKLTPGLIERLSRGDFHVTVFSVGHHDDSIGQRIAASADRFCVLPRDLLPARRAIFQNSVDVLIYTDIGMDQITYSLA